MKQYLYILISVLTLAFVSCKNGNGQKNYDNPQNATVLDGTDMTEAVAVDGAKTYAHYDFLYLDNDSIYFYDLKTHESIRFEGETDNIVNVICSKNGIMYYNVVRDGHLFLKSLDLNLPEAEPELLADWEVTMENNVGDGSTNGNMYFNYDETQIALERDMGWWAGTIYNLAVYDCAEKTMSIQELYRIIKEDDEVVDVEMLYENETFDRWGKYNTSVEDPMDGVIEVDDYVYYVGEGQRVCLNDKINYDECVGFELGICDQDPISIDPTGKRILILVSVGMGDGVLGTYIMSSLDGKEQKVLEATDPEGLAPEWLPDGSLLYGCLSLMDPEGNVINLAETCTYCVLPKTQK